MSNSQLICSNIKQKSVYLPEPCPSKSGFVQSPSPWAIGLTRCQSTNIYTPSELQMRRKAEVLQYKNVLNARVSKKQQYVNVVLGRNRRYGMNTIDREFVCPPSAQKIISTSSSSNVPGRQMLWLDRTIPYIPIGKNRVQYATENIDYL
mgnify:CR=1 FL=1